GCTSIQPSAEQTAMSTVSGVATAGPTPGQGATVQAAGATGPAGESNSPAAAARPLIDSRTAPAAGRLDPAVLDAALQSVRTRHRAQVSVAWGPVGRPDLVQAVGSTPDIEAWSTLKVPIALAVSQAADGKPSASASRLMRLSLTLSDNDAAVALWRSLGSEPDKRVREVLVATGDPSTHPARDAAGRPIAFGLTPWQLTDSARFAALLPCAPDASPVLAFMGGITPEHAWGLGTVAGTRFKGGWGPSPHGYFARQLGLVPRADGRTAAVALAAQPQDGTHESAAAALDEATKVLVSLLHADDGGTCPSS
ncbi:MAG: hypothetical protein Q4P32_06860, partial [Micrococcales bacterium]|nr:hypothetical protein [Micrococcales bacterium]